MQFSNDSTGNPRNNRWTTYNRCAKCGDNMLLYERVYKVHRQTTYIGTSDYNSTQICVGRELSTQHWSIGLYVYVMTRAHNIVSLFYMCLGHESCTQHCIIILYVFRSCVSSTKAYSYRDQLNALLRYIMWCWDVGKRIQKSDFRLCAFTNIWWNTARKYYEMHMQCSTQI
jgi:hypothetical protein